MYEIWVNIENDADCHEQYQSDGSDSENEAHESENGINDMSSEIVTTAQFVKHLQGVRSYLQSPGASVQIYKFFAWTW